jgi:hypothetical protein
MDEELQELVKKGYKGLQLLAELSKQAASIGYLGDKYSTRYLNKSDYRVPQQTRIEWVQECLAAPRYFYKMFRMTVEVFWSLHDLLVSTYGLTTTRFWTVHMKFKEVLKCLRQLAKANIKPRDQNFTVEHPKVTKDRFWPHFKGAIGAIDGSHIKVSVGAEEVVNHTCRHGYTSQNILAVCDFDMRFTFVVAGWPGSAHDTRILNHALTNFGDEFPKPPAGKYYLVF